MEFFFVFFVLKGVYYRCFRGFFDDRFLVGRGGFEGFLFRGIRIGGGVFVYFMVFWIKYLVKR